MRVTSKSLRRILLLGAGSAIAFGMFGAAPAQADNGPHQAGTTTTDGCASCHRAHTATEANLLIAAQPALCYTCHSATAGGATTDVANGVGYPSDKSRTDKAGALRGGGFQFALISSGTAVKAKAAVADNPATVDVIETAAAVEGSVPILPLTDPKVATTSSHNAGGVSTGLNDDMVWGNGESTNGLGTTIGLKCGSCHKQHGNTYYRVLRDFPSLTNGKLASGIVSPKKTTAALNATTDTKIADATSAADKVYTTTNYWNAADSKATDFDMKVSSWCTTCHTRYLATNLEGNTDSGDEVFSYRHVTDGTKLEAYGNRGANCIQCHVAHGSNAFMGTVSNHVATPGGAVIAGTVRDRQQFDWSKEAGSKLLRVDSRGTCNMCHTN